jgi:hypothetical protein
MAVTFAVTLLRKGVAGDRRLHTGTITATGTTTDNGDAITAALFGLHTLQSLNFHPFVDSTSNPENAAAAAYIGTSPNAAGSTAGVVVFFGGAASGSAQASLTDGATMTNYAAQFEAYGT